MMPFRYIGLSDIGLNRLTNQDVWRALPDLGFFALADGMGGRRGGEIAALQAVESISASMHRLAELSDRFQRQLDWLEELRRAMEEANRTVYRIGCESRSLYGMGTTLCCLLWLPGAVCYGHIGDSRIYRMRLNRLEQLTQDHSLFERWLSKKHRELTAPPKHILTKALGTSAEIQPEINLARTEPNDLFLLCSDGLSNALERDELQEILCKSPNLSLAAEEMIKAAKNKGSSDNITVLIIQPGEKTTCPYATLPRQQRDDGA